MEPTGDAAGASSDGLGSFKAWFHCILKKPLPDPAVHSCEQSSSPPLSSSRAAPRQGAAKPNVLLWRSFEKPVEGLALRAKLAIQIAGDFRAPRQPHCPLTR